MPKHQIKITNGERITLVTEHQVISCTVNDVRKRGSPTLRGSDQQTRPVPCSGHVVVDMGELSIAPRSK